MDIQFSYAFIFFLSGIFHSQGESYIYFFKKKVKALLVPYLFFSTTLFMYFFIVSKNIGFSTGENLSVKENFIAIFTGMDILNLSKMTWGVQLWFLLSLFTVSNMAYFIEKINLKYQIILNFVIIIFNIIITKFIKLYFFKTFYINLPWAFLTSLIAFNFYWCGIKIKKRILMNNEKMNCNTLILIILFILNIGITYYNKSPDMYKNFYGDNILLFYISAYSGLIFIIFFVKKFISKNKILEYIGKNSVIILAYHNRTKTLTKVFFIYFLGRQIPKENTLFDLLYSCWEILLCIPIIVILNRYFPYLIGKNYIK